MKLDFDDEFFEQMPEEYKAETGPVKKKLEKKV
jgi:hypothetical protein